MKTLSLVLVGALGALGIASFACGGSDDVPPSLTIALTIEGAGSVTSTPAGFDCHGPTDCGSKTFAANSIDLAAAADSSYTLTAATIDGVAVTPLSPTITVTAGTAARKVVVSFTTGGGPGPVTDGGGNPPTDSGGITDTGTTNDTGATGVTCNGVQCGAGDKCCLKDTSDGGGGSFTFACAATCGNDDFEASCFSPGGCGTGETCCLRATNTPTPGKLSCEPTASCEGLGAPLCDSTHECDQNGNATCTDFDVVSVCLEGQ